MGSEEDYGDDYGYDDDSDAPYEDYEDESDVPNEDNTNMYEEDDSNTNSHYTILNEVGIRQRQEKAIAALAAALSVSTVSASILLRHYKWNPEDVQEAWVEDEEKVRKTVGLMENPIVPLLNDGTSKPNKRGSSTCNICFENYPFYKMDSAQCGHLFCADCWRGYLSTSINDGPGCLKLRCPDPSCNAAIGQNIVNKLVSHKDKEKYAYYSLRPYVEDSRNTKWCPGPGCEHAVDIVRGSGSYDVNCTCSYSFCWNCTEDAHRPVNCDTVAKWVSKATSESENANWILAKTKPCPACRKPIEKNMGCMHMSCRCGFRFCWLCLQNWNVHGYNGACNAYKNDKGLILAEQTRERAKLSLERYHHFYERWMANHNSRIKALEDLKKIESNEIEKLYKKNCDTKGGLEFIKEAWQQIVECRRVLKWSYAYGFYIPEHEHGKKKLFEYVQGEAESALERLHHCAEKEIPDAESMSEGFIEFTNSFIPFRNKLEGLTKATGKYFTGLVEALENGLSEVESPDARVTPEEMRQILEMEEGKLQQMQEWFCQHCTFVNNPMDRDCAVCILPRSGGF